MASASWYPVADFYTDMQGVASELLKEFQQGVITYTPTVSSDWESPVAGTPIPLDATANGVDKQFLSDLITTSDIDVTTAVFGQDPTIEGKVSIDGVAKEIISVRQIPAAGIPVAWKIFVKG